MLLHFCAVLSFTFLELFQAKSDCGINLTLHILLYIAHEVDSCKYVFFFITFTLGVVSYAHPPFFVVGTGDSSHEVKPF
jgi:hypothetical protein